MKARVLMPTYMNKFTCIGGECEDTCCVGWQITLDKKTYKSYKNSKHPQLSKVFQNSMKRNKSEATNNSNYASLRLDECGRCPMLNQDNLCGVQLNLGEEMLSPTCTTYPRVINQVNNILEMSAKLSCPEAARLALLNKEKMECKEVEIDINPLWSLFSTLDVSKSTSAEKYFWNIRIFTIDILQNREWSIEDRLIFLGLFIQKLENLLSQEQVEFIPQLIQDYSVMMENSSTQAVFDRIKGDVKMQMRIIMHLISGRAQLGVSSERYVECFNDMLSGFGENKEDILNIEQLEQQYMNNYKSYYEPFIKDHSYMLENYLVNQVFESLFPKNVDQLFGDYLLIVVLFMLIRIHLVGISGYAKQLNDEIVVKVVQSFSRVNVHSPEYLQSLRDFFKENEFDSLAHAVAMLSTRTV
ncbi:Flagellar biosynthetic protein FliU [compost metagenome]